MPLIKSPTDAARSKNIAQEIREGKPRDQAIAIGYSIQRKAEHSKPKEMSIGEAVKTALSERFKNRK